MRRVIGIDPGSRITGYGIIDSDGRRNVHVASGVIRIADVDFPQRLGQIFRELSLIIEQWKPVEMAIEQVFVAKNAASALKLGQARGAAICAGVMAQLDVAEYTPRMIKQSVVGSGKADKEQVAHMVRMILGLKSPLTPDQADALAVALSHAHSYSTLNSLARAEGAARR